MCIQKIPEGCPSESVSADVKEELRQTQVSRLCNFVVGERGSLYVKLSAMSRRI